MIIGVRVCAAYPHPLKAIKIFDSELDFDELCVVFRVRFGRVLLKICRETSRRPGFRGCICVNKLLSVWRIVNRFTKTKKRTVSPHKSYLNIDKIQIYLSKNHYIFWPLAENEN